ncbi:Proteins of 100 residues with WXG [Amycolatopsis marina]|uniref:Proteins of 100 residues with WXG n=1 Tax=Amycolatopsis marina TaxID=490629 RepID=A0A1I1AT48_9PSEU|nr:WXG100 family type VII secretion target [Amycolatopsis marina]SFB40596.1 Proteins of 100 residues with WXG [Amycolatopsis marina]
MTINLTATAIAELGAAIEEAKQSLRAAENRITSTQQGIYKVGWTGSGADGNNTYRCQASETTTRLCAHLDELETNVLQAGRNMTAADEDAGAQQVAVQAGGGMHFSRL